MFDFKHFFVKGQRVNNLGFDSHLCYNNSVMLLLYESGPKTSRNEWLWLGANKTLFKKIASGQIWPVGHSLPTPGM